MTDGVGSVTAQAGSGQDQYGYTGADHDWFTGLTMHGVRVRGDGPWLTADPIGFAAGDPNLYRYVGNGPTNDTDPSGLQPPTGQLPGTGRPNTASHNPAHQPQSGKDSSLRDLTKDFLKGGSAYGPPKASDARPQPDPRDEAIPVVVPKRVRRPAGDPAAGPTPPAEPDIVTRSRRQLEMIEQAEADAQANGHLFPPPAEEERRGNDDLKRRLRYQIRNGHRYPGDEFLRLQARCHGDPKLGERIIREAVAEWWVYLTEPLPGSPESTAGQMVPVVGSAREVRASVLAGRYDRALVYGGSVILEFLLVKDIAVGGAKLGAEALGRGGVKAAPRAAATTAEVNAALRPGLAARTDADFARMGQLTQAEFDALVEISKKHDVKFGIAGGLAETRAGIARRLNPEAHTDLVPPWRRTGTPKGRDVDLWFEEGTPLDKQLKVIEDVKKLFPDRPEIDAKYSVIYQPESNLNKAGAVVFDKGGTRRYCSPWQE